MKKIIFIYTKNPNYGKSLAKGLCYMNAGLEIFLLDNLEDAKDKTKDGILVTDYEVKADSRIIRLSHQDKLQPVDFTFEKIRKAFKSIWKVELVNGRRNEAMTIGVFSKYGGQGVTSFSTTLARIISARDNKKVLCLSMAKVDDFKDYVYTEGRVIPSKQEYIFAKEEDLAVNIYDYLIDDQWGVSYFMPGENTNFFDENCVRERLIDYVKKEGCFDYIVIDFGKVHSIDIFKIDRKIEFVRKNSIKIMSIESSENEFKLMNFSDYNGGNKDCFCIKEDKESFIDNGEIVEISMKGEYARGIEEFVKTEELVLPEIYMHMQNMSE